MTLKTLFAIPIAIILIVTLSLAGMLAGQGWSGLARGKAAVVAVERMRLLLELQSDLRIERLVSNIALAKPYPLPTPLARRLADARLATDRAIETVADRIRVNERDDNAEAALLTDAGGRLRTVRAGIDAMLVSGPAARTYASLYAIMPDLLAVSRLLEGPLRRSGLEVTSADVSLSGLVAEDRISASLLDQVSLIAAVLSPRSSAGEAVTAADLDAVSGYLARAETLTDLIADTVEIAGTTPRISASLDALRAIAVHNLTGRLNLALSGDDAAALPPAQRVLVPWGKQIDRLRTAIVEAIVDRAEARRAANESRFDLVMAAFGAIMVAILESVVLLSHRVVAPLAQLGVAITRIAAGDRGTALRLPSGSREIAEMVTAVETLRVAALVADAATMRQRLAARHRLLALRQALGIVQTVREPARALERGVASLSEGIDRTIALITATAAPPPTLDAAAIAVRVGLAEMRDSAAGLEATLEAGSTVQAEDWPEADFVAHILAIKTEVDRCDATVRGFTQPSLMALRDAGSLMGMARVPVLRDLVVDQFEHIETAVATVAAMLAAVSRASSIVRELSPEETAMAA